MDEKSYLESDFDILKGKEIITAAWDESKITFYTKGDLITEAGTFVFNAVGDCCSHSYIESLDNPEIFNNAIFESVTIVSGKEKTVKTDKWDSDVHKWSFYKFKTSKGMCTLSFRNESNGYYDGSLEWEHKWTHTGER